MRKIENILSVIVMLAVVLMFVYALTSCTRYYTPQQAADSGGKTCRQRHAIY